MKYQLCWWWCGNSQEDGGCDCVAPKIINEAGMQVEAGPYTSPACEATPEEVAEQETWAKEACAKYGCEYFSRAEQFSRDRRKAGRG